MVNFCKSSKCLTGKTAIVTGGNTGIGYETALDFAKRGCRVILACRNQEKANEAKDKIIKATGNSNVIVKSLNLDTMASVRAFANDIINTEDRLDLLINNAGAMALPLEYTPDEFKLQIEMATNYYGPFLLTVLLLDLLKKSAPSRVVNVASWAGSFIYKLNFDDINTHGGDWMLYCRTKLCNILFTQELARRLEGTGVTTYSLHPGAVNSEFSRFSSIAGFLASKFFKTPEEGAQTTIYLALEDDIEEHSGQHFENCKKVKPYCAARDPEVSKQLWELTEKMLKLSN